MISKFKDLTFTILCDLGQNRDHFLIKFYSNKTKIKKTIKYRPEWVDNLEDLLVRMTRRSPSSPSKIQINTAARFGLNLSGSFGTGVMDSWNPTWDTTFPALSWSACISSASSSNDEEGGGLYIRSCWARAASRGDPPKEEEAVVVTAGSMELQRKVVRASKGSLRWSKNIKRENGFRVWRNLMRRKRSETSSLDWKKFDTYSCETRVSSCLLFFFWLVGTREASEEKKAEALLLVRNCEW